MSVWNLQNEKLLPPPLRSLKIYFCRLWPWVDKRKAKPFIVALEEPPQVVLNDEKKLIAISRKLSPIKYPTQGVYVDGQPPKFSQLEKLLAERPWAQVEYRVPLGEKVLIRAVFNSSLTEAIIFAQGSDRLEPVKWTNLSPWVIKEYLTSTEGRKKLGMKIVELILR